MSEIIFPSLNMLPLSDLVQYLNNRVDSKNTEMVGLIPSSEVAKCHNLNQEWVKHAAYLGERPADDYLTIEKDSSALIKQLSEAVEDMTMQTRLEIYRLYDLLNQANLIQYNAERGFVETYDELQNNMLTTPATVTIASGYVTKVHPENQAFALEKEYIVVTVDTKSYVTQISTIENGIYTLAGSKIPLETVVKVQLSKLKGTFTNTTFSFANIVDETIDKEALNVMLGDYASSQNFAFNELKGYATSIIMRKNILSIDGTGEKAVLSEVRACLNKIGSPRSALTCKVYKVIAYNQDKPILDIIGLSSPIVPSEINGTWLNIPILSPTGTPVIIEMNTEIVVAFECATSSVENCYSISVGIGASTDLHSNRKIFTMLNEEYVPFSEGEDILLSVKLNTVKRYQKTALNEGLYSSTYFLQSNTHPTKALMNFRFTKDQVAKVQSDTVVNGQQGFSIDVPINCEVGCKLVVGNQIVTLFNRQGNLYRTQEAVIVRPGDAVYPLPFKVQLLCYSDLLNTTPSKVLNMKLSKLHLKKETLISDYIIYEANIDKQYQSFQLQIVYEDMLKTSDKIIEVQDIQLSFIEGMLFVESGDKK